jgi:hypothetical protein
MKLLADYLERATQLEILAATESDPAVKERLITYATSYRKLAAERAKDLGLPDPPVRR